LGVSYAISPDWVSAAATVVGLGVIVVQLRQVSRQIRLQNFSDYTKRYQEIILHFPEDINRPDFTLHGRQDYPETMRYMRAYMDLCYEERYLHQQKLIDRDFWRVWRIGMETAFSKPAFQQAWTIIKTDSNFGTDFERFVDESIQAKPSS